MKSSSRILSLNPSRLGKPYLLKVFICSGLQNIKVPCRSFKPQQGTFYNAKLLIISDNGILKRSLATVPCAVRMSVTWRGLLSVTFSSRRLMLRSPQSPPMRSWRNFHLTPAPTPQSMLNLLNPYVLSYMLSSEVTDSPIASADCLNLPPTPMSKLGPVYTKTLQSGTISYLHLWRPCESDLECRGLFCLGVPGQIVEVHPGHLDVALCELLGDHSDGYAECSVACKGLRVELYGALR